MNQHNHMGLVGVRMLVLLLAMLYAALGALCLFAFGLHREALRTIIIGVLIGWTVAPDKAAQLAYMDFQRQRGLRPDE